MDIVVSTIYFNGQFWIALIEKTAEDGTYYLGRYTFGSEPSNPELLDFYLRKYVDVLNLPTNAASRPVKLKARRNEMPRMRKSLDAFKALQSAYLSEKKTIRKMEDRERDEAKYEDRREKRKKKKRGH